MLHNLSSNIFLLLHKEGILHHFKLCILCLYLPVGQQGKNMHNNTVCKSHYRGDLMIYTIKCGEKIYILHMSVSLIDQMSCKILAYWIPAKNPTSCIPNLKPLKFCSCSLKQVQEYKLIKADLLYAFSLLPPLPAKSCLAVVTTMSLQCHISLTPDNQPHLLSAV